MPLPFQPEKRLGQHFLRDEKTLRRICEAAELEDADEIVEIGPGYGNLTRFLLKKSAKVRAVEKDRRLVENFPDDIASDKKLFLIEADVMKTGIAGFFSGRPMKMVSNLPYGISSGVLQMFTEHRKLFSLAVLMLQREVALRIVAPPGSRQSGSLSLTMRMFFKAEKLFDVSPSLFIPRPAVASSVVRLVPLEDSSFPLKNESFYIKTVRAAFSGRRKMIRNSLCSLFSRQQVEKALEQSSVDGTKRAENLGLEEFSLISDRLFETAGEKSDNGSF